ncbi:hypothetical protein DDP54_02720 [Cellulomonas sp. WB94]|uniref:AMIN-like domain-containing (lipo)protein n=1 Tax=Cellulomonas sp. WB94 TaxID=2173174 RepID=UPI000D57A002|nr:hypothetical protein [Cellulomonas sp. WB94]PVU82100.1 hypothetical protein DDP54_02720 [Cellulomonas sp. WB94]
MKRFMRVLLVVLLAATGVTLASPADASPYCGIRWGSLTKTDPAMSSAPMTAVRTGRHACYDRLVIDVAGPAGGYTVGYVSQVAAEGSGLAIALRGRAFLQIVVHDPAYDVNTGTATYTPANPKELAKVATYRTFRQVAWGGSFEGYTTIGLGTRARLPFRVFTLDGPGTGSRIVVDVAHRW